MGENEEATLRTLSSHRKLIDSLIEQHHGRFVNSAADSVLADFASVVNAVQCAVEIQTTLKTENANLPPDRRMEFRIGVNLGDVMVDGEQIYGDGVNVAARLESLAEPGSIFISGSVHEQLGNKLALGYEDLGEQSVKNIAKPVRVFRVLTEGGDADQTDTKRLAKICASRRLLSRRARDRRRDGRARAASLVAPAGPVRVHPLCAHPRAYLARQTLHRRSAIHQLERRSAGGIFQRWNYRRHYHRALQVARFIRDRSRFHVLLQGQTDPRPAGEPRTRSEVRAGGWSAEGGRPPAGLGPARGCDHRRGTVGRALRPPTK